MMDCADGEEHKKDSETSQDSSAKNLKKSADSSSDKKRWRGRGWWMRKGRVTCFFIPWGIRGKPLFIPPMDGEQKERSEMTIDDAVVVDNTLTSNMLTAVSSFSFRGVTLFHEVGAALIHL